MLVVGLVYIWENMCGFGIELVDSKTQAYIKTHFYVLRLANKGLYIPQRWIDLIVHESQLSRILEPLTAVKCSHPAIYTTWPTGGVILYPFRFHIERLADRSVEF